MSTAGAATVPGRAKAASAGLGTVVGCVQLLALLAVAVDGQFFSAGSAHINSERVVLAPVLILLTFPAIGYGKLQIPNPTRFYFLWTVTVLFSTLLSWSPLDHVNGLIVSVVPFFYFVLFSQRSFTFSGMGRMIEAWIWLVGGGSVIAFLIWKASGQLGFMLDGNGRVNFLMFEPNILGAVMASMMLAHFAFFKPISRHFVLHGVGLLTLLLTASRFPYLAYAISFSYYLFRSGHIRRPIILAGVVVGLVAAAFAAGFFADSVVAAYSSNLDRADSVNTRLTVLSFAWDHFLARPILGNGPLDISLTGFPLLGMIGSTDIRDLWIWQIWVAILHDEGVIGLLFFVAFLVACWRRTERMIAQGYSYFVAYQAAAIALLISSQGTTEHLTAAWGVIFGLAASPPLVAGLRGAAQPAMRGARQARMALAGSFARRRGAQRAAAIGAAHRAGPPRYL